MLENIYISNKYCPFNFLFIKELWKIIIMVSTNILSSKNGFSNIDHNINY